MKHVVLVGILILTMLTVERSQAWARPIARSAAGVFPSAPSLCVGDAQHGWLAEQNRVLLTTDGGQTWKISFRGRFQRASEFQAAIGCAGNTAWALFTGPGAAMNQKPYVLYRTIDGGAHWVAEMEEGYFGSVYPTARTQRNLGAYPGPFTVVNRMTAYFLGTTVPTGPQGTVELSATVDAGRTWRQTPIPCLSALHPLSLAFVSAHRGWVVGVCNGRNSVLATTDGGRTWFRHPIP